MLAAAVFWLYWPALRFGFSRYDDLNYFAQNPHVQAGLGWDGLWWAFRSVVVSNWHPLTMLSFMLDATIAGTLDPSVPHFTNILLHAINSVLLFLLLQFLTDAKWRSLFVAGLFALHPLNVESVVWIAERKNVLSTGFWLLTIFAYARYVRDMAGGKWQMTGKAPIPSGFTFHASRFYWLALLFFALGLMSKPMLVTLPFVLLLLDDWPWERWRMTSARDWRVRLPGLVREKAPFFLLSGLSCAVTVLTQQQNEGERFMDGFPLGGRIENAFVSYPRYLGKMCWPVNLAVLYPHPGHWPLLTTVAAAIFILAASFVVMQLGKKYRYLGTGWFWFLGTLIPVIGLVQVGGQSMADRYTYVPLIGMFILVSWGAFQIFQRLKFPGAAMFAVAGVILVAGACQSRKQISYWQNDETLLLHAAAVTRNNVVAHFMLGLDLVAAEKPEAAIKQLQEVLADSPTDKLAIFVHYELGIAQESAGHPVEAEQEYREAVRINPDFFQAHYNLGTLLKRLGRRAEAIEQLTVTLRLHPGITDANKQLRELGVNPP
jgi:tetratricopeptide (TPR) repeat protein